MASTNPNGEINKSKETKEIAKSKNSNQSSGKEDERSKSKASKSKGSGDIRKKSFKIVIRKLPVRDFNREDFRANVSRILTQLGYAPGIISHGSNQDTEQDLVQIEHFIEGKLR
jgi:hypothetical protein